MQNDKDELKFKPLTEGLGFHPFSQGLPYTPSAGALQSHTAPKSPSLGTSPMPPLPKRSAALMPLPSPARAKTNLKKEEVAEVEAKPGLKRFYLLRRTLAFWIDMSLFLIALNLSFLLSSTWAEIAEIPSAVFISTLGFSFLCVVLEETFLATTIGKWLFGLELDGKFYQRFFRGLLFLASLGVWGLGLLWVLFDGKRRGWHDILTGVQPAEKLRNE